MNGRKGSGEAPSDAESRQALKKAGEEYFLKVLDQARQGKNPLNEDPRSRAKHAQDVESQNEDLETVGVAIPYLVGILHCAGTAAWLPLAKRSMHRCQTPGIQAFLHLLPTACTLYCLMDVGPLTAKSLRAASVSIILFGAQILAILGALQDSSLYLVLSWTTFLPPLLSLYSPRDKRLSFGPLKCVFLAVGFVGSVICVFARLWPPKLGLLLLIVWTAMEAFRVLWEEMIQHPDSFSLPFGLQILEEIGNGERELPPACLAFLKVAIVAVPALILGFVFQEGNKLIEYELSVPAVESILLSCLAWTVSTVAGVSYFKRSKSGAKQSLTAFVALGSPVLWLLLSLEVDWLRFGACMVTLIGGIGAQQCKTERGDMDAIV